MGLSSSLRMQLVAFGAVAVLGTSLALTAVGAIQSRQLANQATDDIEALTEESLEQTSQSARELVTTQVDTVSSSMASQLAVAEQTLKGLGELSFGEPQKWEAKNQTSGDVTSVDLPTLVIGETPLARESSFKKSVALVDEVTKLLGSATTIFQVMNDQGDMLRVATTVENADGDRAIGTFISATNADGKPNAVIESLKSGRPYYGTATVVGQQYVTAYAPLVIDGELIGAIFVGQPQSNVDKPLREALARVTVGNSGYVTVISDAGTWVVPPPGVEEGAPADAEYVASIVDAGKAIEEPTGTSNLKVTLPEGGASVEVTRFAPWGWTIAAWGMNSDMEAVPKHLQSGMTRLTLTLMLVGLVVAALAVAFIVFASGRIVGRVSRITAALRRVADHDLSRDFKGEGKDEIGRMGDALGQTILAMRSAVGTLRSGAQAVGSTAGQLSGSSTGLQAAASQTANHASSTAETASVMNSGVQSVTAAMTQMRSTIESVARDVQLASDETRSAVSTASTAAHITERLGDSSSRIAEVLKAVTAIASQTNLLALNATIEAARAGEAGRSFAVVAGEVKDLAQQTASAIDTIRPVLEEVASDSAEVKEAVARVTESITNMVEHQESISAAIEQQTATTSEIERNLMVAADGTHEISSAASELAESAQDAQRSAHEVGGVVSDLTSIASELAAGVDKFTLA